MELPTTWPTVTVKGCRRCLVLPRRKKFQGKTGQRGSAANFSPVQERQHKKKKKRLLSPMASVGGGVIIKGRQC